MTAKKPRKKKGKDGGGLTPQDFLPVASNSPTKKSMYRPIFARIAKGMAELGATDIEIADVLGVTVATLKNWSRAYKPFRESLVLGKVAADTRVERSMYERAVGYTFESEKVHFLTDGTIVRAETREHVPPDPKVGMWWLNNRAAERWRGSQQDKGGTLVVEVRRFDWQGDQAPKKLNGGNGHHAPVTLDG